MQTSRRTSIRLLVTTLVALATAFPAAKPALAGDNLAAGETVLPSRTCGSHILVDLAVGGDPDKILTMILDTGASHTIIDPDSAYRVSGQYLGKEKWVNFETLTLGKATFRKVRARGRNLDHIARALGHRVDGILGFPVFAGTLLTLDYPAGEVRIRDGHLDPDDADVYPLASRETRRPWITLQIAGRSRTVLIDSGSGSGLVLNRSNSYSWITRPLPIRSSMRINRLQIREMGRLDDLVAFGPAELLNPLVEITNATPLVGTAILGQFVLTFDQKNQLMRIQYAGDGPVIQDSIRGTGLVFNPTHAGLEVVRVLKDSPAARVKIRKGDLVTAINGRPVLKRECGGFGHRSTDEDKDIVLTITRKDASRDILVDVVDIIP